jgi:hypothetical protein
VVRDVSVIDGMRVKMRAGAHLGRGTVEMRHCEAPVQMRGRRPKPPFYEG